MFDFTATLSTETPSMSETNKSRLANLGPLHDLLIEACPTGEGKEMKSIANLARAIDYTPQALYKAISRNRISPTLAAKIVEAADKGTVSLEDFHPYVYV